VNLNEQHALEYHLSQQSEEVDENLRLAILGFRTLDLLVANNHNLQRSVKNFIFIITATFNK